MGRAAWGAPGGKNCRKNVTRMNSEARSNGKGRAFCMLHVIPCAYFRGGTFTDFGARSERRTHPIGVRPWVWEPSSHPGAARPCGEHADEGGVRAHKHQRRNLGRSRRVAPPRDGPPYKCNACSSTNCARAPRQFWRTDSTHNNKQADGKTRPAHHPRGGFRKGLPLRTPDLARPLDGPRQFQHVKSRRLDLMPRLKKRPER